jgi:dephospho-CoA kinase
MIRLGLTGGIGSGKSIIHPLVGLQVQTQAAEAHSSGHRCAVFDIPLLVESAHWRQRVDQVLVVDCSAEVQCQRVMARSQLTRAEVEAIMASQATRPRRLAAADVVIFNDQISLAQLALDVRQLAPVFGLSSG